jgi:transposase
MKRFVEGMDRGQSTLFPEFLEDWICEDNPVRVIDVFVGGLDLAELRFCGVDPETTGRPSYHPSVLLKLYITVISIGFNRAAGLSVRRAATLR